jgi:hypothetical protein
MAQINPGAATHLTAFVASTADYSAPLAATLDGVNVQIGQRVLRTGQTTPSQNGLYTITGSGTNLVSGSYSGGGSITISGLTVGTGLTITWGNATSLVINGVTISPNTAAGNGVIKVTATSLTLNGPNSTASTANIQTLTATAATDGTGLALGTQVNVTNGANNSGVWVYSATNTWTLITGATTINTTGSSGASQTSALQTVNAAVQALQASSIQIVGTVAALRAAGPNNYSGYVMTIDSNGASKVTTVWKWSAASNATDDGVTVVTPTGYSGTTGRYLFQSTF